MVEVFSVATLVSASHQQVVMNMNLFGKMVGTADHLVFCQSLGLG